MAEGDGTGATPAAGSGDPGTQDPKVQDPAGAKPASGGDPGDLGDAGKKALDAEREARKQAEAQLREAQAKLKAVDDEKLTETQRLQNAVSESEGKITAASVRVQELQLRDVARDLMPDLGIQDHHLALAALNPADVEFDEDGVPKRASVKDALEKILKAHPILAGTAGGGTNRATSVTNGQRNSTTFSRSQIRDAEFFRANKEAILAAQREGRITND